MYNDLAFPVLGALVMAGILLIDAMRKWWQTITREYPVEEEWWIDVPITITIFVVVYAMLIWAYLCLLMGMSRKFTDPRRRGE